MTVGRTSDFYGLPEAASVFSSRNGNQTVSGLDIQDKKNDNQSIGNASTEAVRQ